MHIDEKLKNLKPYLVSLRYDGKRAIIDVQFKPKWSVPESSSIKVQKFAELPNTYMFYSDVEGIVIDDIAEYVDEVIRINLEREEKVLLLKNKIEELQEFFYENELEDLKRMEFTIPLVGEDIEAPWEKYSKMDKFEVEDNVKLDNITTDKPSTAETEEEIQEPETEFREHEYVDEESRE